jgi:TetR/AcrR family tetracycline transcriptional repressor
MYNMSMSPERIPGQRAGLSRALVRAAGRELLAKHGIEAVTMRAVAARLGVHPNALYSHVESKAHLLDDILDETLAEVETPASEAGVPMAGVQAVMTSTYRVLLRHSDLLPLYLARQGARGQNAHHLGNIILMLLARSGISGAEAREALKVLIVYTIGSAAFATRSPLPLSSADNEAAADDHAESFERGLRWLLTGVMSHTPPSLQSQ